MPGDIQVEVASNLTAGKLSSSASDRRDALSGDSPAHSLGRSSCLVVFRGHSVSSAASLDTLGRGLVRRAGRCLPFGFVCVDYADCSWKYAGLTLVSHKCTVIR